MENNKIRKETPYRNNGNSLNPSTIIVGAGYAGLVCAIKLIQNNHKVTIIEASPKAGGRSKSIVFDDNIIDNGQHLLIGAYTETLKLLQSIGVNESNVLTRMPMRLLIKGINKNIDISRLILSKSFTIKEKLLILYLFIKLYKHKFSLKKDCSILQALTTFNQTESLIKNFWEPIALAIMSTSIDVASANIFFKILKDVFINKNNYSNWLFPCKDLDHLLTKPAIKYLSSNGANVIFKQPINKIIYENEKCIGIANSENSWFADNIVLATPTYVTAKLLDDNSTTKDIANNLFQIKYNSITTIYLIFKQSVNLPYTMIGLLNKYSLWVFDRKICKQPNIISVVTTTNIKTSDIISLLRKHFPNLPEIVSTKVVQEKRAAFSCTYDMQHLRPMNNTNISNLFLAGDYTQTGYPSTIEGAIRSGISCATSIPPVALTRDSPLL